MSSANLNLEEYRCRKYNRVFYVDATQPHALDLDFGCPYGCDDNGERERDIVAEIKETADGRVNHFSRLRDYQIVLRLLPGAFELSTGRSPHDQAEFDAWAAQVEDGLLNGQIDWNTLYRCAFETVENTDDDP
jgi:hypothetical protein